MIKLVQLWEGYYSLGQRNDLLAKLKIMIFLRKMDILKY